MIRVTLDALRDKRACWDWADLIRYFGKRKWISLKTLLFDNGIALGHRLWLAEKFLPLADRMIICDWFDAQDLERQSWDDRAFYIGARKRYEIWKMSVYSPWHGREIWEAKRPELLGKIQEIVK